MKSQWTEKRIMVLKIGIDLDREKEGGVLETNVVRSGSSLNTCGTTESSKQHIEALYRKDIIYFFLSAP